MSAIIIVGITGRARSGKDSVAQALVTHRGCFRVALADGVKAAFDDLSGVQREFHKDLDVAGLTNRWGWQQLGTEARLKAESPALWVDLVATKIAYSATIHPRPIRRFVIPDIRYGLEVDMLRERAEVLGARIAFLKVTRPAAEEYAAVHSSEKQVGDITPDFTIENTVTLDWLAAEACRVFDSFVSRAGDKGVDPIRTARGDIAPDNLPAIGAMSPPERGHDPAFRFKIGDVARNKNCGRKGRVKDTFLLGSRREGRSYLVRVTGDEPGEEWDAIWREDDLRRDGDAAK